MATALRFLGLWLLATCSQLLAQEPPAPRADEEPPAKKDEKRDPRVAAIAKAMAEQAAKPVPVAFKIRVQEEHPVEDTKVTAAGELYAIGDQKLRFMLDIRVGRMPGNRTELTINEDGAWVRFPIGGVVKFAPDLWKKIQFMQKRGKGNFGGGGSIAGSQMDILANLEAQGFVLAWRGQKKLGELVVDEIQGTRKAPGAGGSVDDPAGRIDRCLLLIGEKDRIPRHMEWFAGQESLRLIEYYDVEVGKQLDPKLFVFQQGENDLLVDALKHPLLGPSLQDLLREYKELEEQTRKQPPAPPERGEG